MKGDCVEKMELGAKSLNTLKKRRDWKSSLAAVVKWNDIFKISLGFEPIGTKIKKGDGKTPEGLYFIEDKIRKSSFFLALKVSYPNPWDIRRALELNYHPGGQIMIHGVPNIGYERNYHNSNNDWTEGCIAISNQQMLKIWKKISVGTPILIKK